MGYESVEALAPARVLISRGLVGEADRRAGRAARLQVEADAAPALDRVLGDPLDVPRRDPAAADPARSVTAPPRRGSNTSAAASHPRSPSEVATAAHVLHRLGKPSRKCRTRVPSSRGLGGALFDASGYSWS